jgi:hypothetical protein
MNKARFWFGTVTLVVPVLLIALAFAPGIRLIPRGPVEGRVSYHGRPLAGGSILFVPEDSRQAQCAYAWIDDDGHYVIGPGWRREGSGGKSRFRICVIPDSHETAGRASQGARDKDGGGVATVWFGSSDLVFPAPSPASGFPQGLNNPKTTKLEVQLGAEATRIDVAL